MKKLYDININKYSRKLYNKEISKRDLITRIGRDRAKETFKAYREIKRAARQYAKRSPIEFDMLQRELQPTEARTVPLTPYLNTILQRDVAKMLQYNSVNIVDYAKEREQELSRVVASVKLGYDATMDFGERNLDNFGYVPEDVKPFILSRGISDEQAKELLKFSGDFNLMLNKLNEFEKLNTKQVLLDFYKESTVDRLFNTRLPNVRKPLDGKTLNEEQINIILDKEKEILGKAQKSSDEVENLNELFKLVKEEKEKLLFPERVKERQKEEIKALKEEIDNLNNKVKEKMEQVKEKEKLFIPQKDKVEELSDTIKDLKEKLAVKDKMHQKEIETLNSVIKKLTPENNIEKFKKLTNKVKEIGEYSDYKVDLPDKDIIIREEAMKIYKKAYNSLVNSKKEFEKGNALSEYNYYLNELSGFKEEVEKLPTQEELNKELGTKEPKKELEDKLDTFKTSDDLAITLHSYELTFMQSNDGKEKQEIADKMQDVKEKIDNQYEKTMKNVDKELEKLTDYKGSRDEIISKALEEAEGKRREMLNVIKNTVEKCEKIKMVSDMSCKMVSEQIENNKAVEKTNDKANEKANEKKMDFDDLNNNDLKLSDEVFDPDYNEFEDSEPDLEPDLEQEQQEILTL